MPRTARASIDHARNRGNRSEAVFLDPDAFVEARRRIPLDIFDDRPMPNHVHLVVRPKSVVSAPDPLETIPGHRPAGLPSARRGDYARSRDQRGVTLRRVGR